MTELGNSDSLYIATLTLDQDRVKEAISPEQRRYSMAQDVATHGVQITALFVAHRAREKEMEKYVTALEAISEDVARLQGMVRVLVRCVIVLACISIWLAWAS